MKERKNKFYVLCFMVKSIIIANTNPEEYNGA